MTDRPLRRRAGADRDLWMLVLLALVFLVPAGAVLWFTNRAVAAQSEVARQRVVDAYRGQLRLVRSRIDAHWQRHAAQLDGSDGGAARFVRLVLGQVADGVVVLDSEGTVAFPDAATGAGPMRELAIDRRARAVRHEVRTLLQEGNRAGALQLLQRHVGGASVAAAGDVAARVLAADELLLEAQGAAGDSARREQAIAGLAAMLNDYTFELPSSQRLFLMGELRLLARNVRLPTEGALRLTSEFVDAAAPLPGPGGFRLSPLPDVWALPSADGRAIGLYRTGRLEALLHEILHEVAPEGIRFVAFPPGVPADANAIDAGPWLPGWQLSFQTVDMSPFEAASHPEVLTSLAAGFVALALMTVVGAMAGRTLRRELRLARLKTDLVAAVSHELRTPVASVGVLVEGLLADREVDPEKTREYLRLIAGENARLGRVVESFLTFARLDRHAHQFVFAPVAPAQVVRAAVDAVRDRLPADVTLEVEAPDALPLVSADRDALVTALVNLLDNAIKYRAAAGRIHIGVTRDAGAIVFSVEDNGIGIPLREQQRIFRRFHRVDQRLSRETGGVGLGLSIVDLIVRAHGGSVEVVSETGAGSTFTMRLPCAAGPAPA